MDKASKFYEEDYKDGQFLFMYCWKAMHEQPKWHAYMEKLKKFKKRRFSKVCEAVEDLSCAEHEEDILHLQRTKAAKTECKLKGKGKGNGKALATIEVIDEIDEKLEKFMNAQSESSKGHGDMFEVQQCMSVEKLEMKRLAAIAAKEKEAKMLDTYKALLMHDTRGMSDDIKAEHMKTLKCTREKLFGPSD